MKKLNIFNKERLIEKMKFFTVTVIDKKITDQIPEISYEEFYELKEKEDVDAIGLVKGFKVIIKSKSNKYFWINRLTFIDYLINSMLAINPEMNSTELHKKAFQIVDTLPQLFEK